MNDKYNFLTFLLCLGTILFHSTESCTMICGGKKTTVDGSVYVAHTDDAGDSASDLRLIYVPAANYSKNELRPVYNFRGGYPRVVTEDRGEMYQPKHENETSSIPMGFIPQVEHTYAYFDQDYGLMNEKQLMIGESTCGARTVGWSLEQKPHGKNLMNIGELSKIALERCETARCAIKTMGDLSVKYGFYSDDSDTPENPNYGDSSEALGIADRFGEVWVFHVMTGIDNSSAIWAAQRVPDENITIIANGFTIRKLNLTDSDNYMASENVYSSAIQVGWYTPKVQNDYSDFDFTAVYGFNGDYPFTPLYVGRRMWRVFDLVAPSLKLDSTIGYTSLEETYPFSVKPDNLLDLEALRNILSDTFKNTPYDMGQGLSAGPFHMPIRYDGPDHNITGGWERPVSMYRTIFSFILNAKVVKPEKQKTVEIEKPQIANPADSADLSGTIWYGQSSPHGTVYVPFNCLQTTLPKVYYEHGKESEFSFDSAFWVFSFVNNWSYLRYSIISPDLLKRRESLQQEAYAFDKEVKHHLAHHTMTMDEKKKYMTKKYNKFAEHVVKEWWTLAFQLISKYSDGFITKGEGPNDMEAPGYPNWFLQHTEFAQWPGNTYLADVNDSSLAGTMEGNVPRLVVLNTTDVPDSNATIAAMNLAKKNAEIQITTNMRLVSSERNAMMLNDNILIEKSSWISKNTGTVLTIFGFVGCMTLGFVYGTYLGRRRNGYYRID